MEVIILQMVEVFKALSDLTRLKILRLITTKNQNFFVGEIAEKLGISNSAISQHLKILKHADIVHPVRDGYKVYYQLNKKAIKQFPSDVANLVELVFLPCNFEGSCKDCPQEKECT
jgi:ArsR family transcriptional regulator